MGKRRSSKRLLPGTGDHRFAPKTRHEPAAPVALTSGSRTSATGRASTRREASPTEFASRFSYLPVPLSCTVWVPAASLISKVAVRAPLAAGVKVTVIVHSKPAFRLDPQVDFAGKSPGSAPDTVTLLTSSVEVWLFVTRIVSAFFDPTATVPNF